MVKGKLVAFSGRLKVNHQ